MVYCWKQTIYTHLIIYHLLVSVNFVENFEKLDDICILPGYQADWVRYKGYR